MPRHWKGKERNDMINNCKSNMPNHYGTIKKMMGTHLKENLSNKEVLKDTLFCNKRLFLTFLSSVRRKNPKHSVWWGIVRVEAARRNGSTRCTQNKIGMALGSSCSIKTRMEKTRPFCNKMDLVATKLLDK